MKLIKDDIYWTGIKDWDLRRFHGHELSTHRGSTYNAYLIKDEKNVLVDTVWDPYKEELAEGLENEVGLENIDFIVVNHDEPDHGGSLGHLLERRPDIPIYCTKNGADIIRKHFHKDWNFRIVKTGDTVKTGKYELMFIETPMIHWPDSMMTYVKGANVLLSSDAFGQHLSTLGYFNDEVDTAELYQEAIKYYACILGPFTGLIKKKIEEIRKLNLPIDVIAPSHGVMWRDNPMQIIDKYDEWSNAYKEDHVIFVYDTMYNATRMMAEAIAQGLEKHGINYKLYNSSVSDQSDLVTEIFKARAVIMGSCTVNNGVLRSIAGMLEEIRGHKFKGKIGAAFGSYGWSGEAHKQIHKGLQESGIQMPLEPIAFKYRPTEEELKQCVEYGEKLAQAMKQA